jgi:hypothetical protein
MGRAAVSRRIAVGNTSDWVLWLLVPIAYSIKGSKLQSGE